MNVLQVAGSLESWGGIERYVCNLSDGLISSGAAVTVACQRHTPLFEHWKGDKVSTKHAVAHRWTSVSQYLRILRQQNYDVIHSHYSPDFFGAAIAARLVHVPRIVLTRHLALPWTLPKAKILGRLYDQLICVSDAVQRELAHCGVPEGKLTVAKMGIQPLAPSSTHQSIREKFRIAPELFAVGFIGRLTVEKGVKTLLESLQYCENVQCHIFGDGPQKDELVKIADRISNIVIKFHGHQDDVSDAMESVDTVITPSEWKEAFPAVVLEAMSLSKPVIGSRIGGIPEIITDGKNGLLFSPRNAKELSQCIARLQTQPDFARLIGINGKEAQERDFTVQVMGERFKRVYESLPAAR